MKKKNKKTVLFPPDKKTEFARFTDPDEFTFDPDLPGLDRRDESFFEDGSPQTEQRNDYQV